MPASKQISTGKLIEWQTDGGALVANAVGLGYIASDVELVEITLEGFLAAVDEGVTEAKISSAVQALLDTEAQARGYDSILSAASYAGYLNDFQAEGVALATWRSTVWAYCYAQLALVQSGGRAAPATVNDFIAEIKAAAPL